MPTYTVRATHLTIDSQTRQHLGTAITEAHTAATGAQGFFAQVYVEEVSAADHFVAGAPIEAPQVFVQGQIRGGRTAEQRQALLEGVASAVVSTLGVARRSVWVYLVELPAASMVEYGRVLPEPGAEAEWLASLPEADRPASA